MNTAAAALAAAIIAPVAVPPVAAAGDHTTPAAWAGATARPVAERRGSRPPRVVLPPVLRCIRWAESRGHYRVVSWDGEHRGAYQLSIVYSGAWARRYGRPRWAPFPANRWPRRVQDHVALGLFRDWPGAWSTLGACR